MIKQFYEKLLPSQGNYCVGGISNEGRIQTTFVRSIDAVLARIEKFNQQGVNVYVTPATYRNNERKQVSSLYVKSLFIDLDVRDFAVIEEKDQKKYYPSKDAALEALDEFIRDSELPPPVRVDSGRGIQAYWMFSEDVSAAQWKPVADAWKSLLRRSKLKYDPTVPADSARFMRALGSFNQRGVPPIPTKLLDEELNEYSFEEFKEFLGASASAVVSTSDVLAKASKGLDEDTLKITKQDNYEYVFQQIAERSLEGAGCAQIKDILENSSTTGYEKWTAGLTIAIKCVDGEEAVHLMSEDYPGYDREATLRKAQSFGGVYTCERFRDIDPDLCDGCPHADKPNFKTPIQLGKQLRQYIPAATETDAVREIPNTQTVPELPEFLFPFSRGVNGGIYFTPAAKTMKDGKKIQDDPILLFAHDIYPVRRVYSPHDGECMVTRLVLPQDPEREFLMPMSVSYKKEDFTKLMVSNGATFNSSGAAHFMKYFEKWGQYLVSTKEAEIMRMQFGWTEDKTAFVTGACEIRLDGTEVPTSPSPYVKKLSKLIRPAGTYDAWRAAVEKLNMPGFELHAFGLFCGFGSPLMTRHPKVSGVTVCFTGKSGNGKTGAMYAGASVFMHPKEGSIQESTDNGLTGRYLTLHSLMFGLDEISNWSGEEISGLIHRVSQGKAKVRMQGSVNAERELELSAALILLMTSNQAISGKLEGFKAYAGGELARAIEFIVERPQALDDDPNLGPDIFTAIQHNYGHAGPMFIKACMRLGMEEVDKRIAKWIRRFQSDYKFDASLRFYEGLMTAFVGAEIAVESGIITMDVERIYRVTMKHIIRVAEDTAKSVDIDYSAIISEFINAHHTGLIVFEGSKVVSEPRTALVGRGDVEEGVTYISKTLFREYLNKRQISAKEFEFAMQEEGLLVPTKKQRLTSGWKAGFHAPAIAVYGFKFELPKELFDGPAENTGT
jgi:hypothetical protein